MKYESKQRREWMEYYFNHGQNASATCEAFGISRTTLYKWLRRYDPQKPTKPLKERSRRPKTKRKRTWTDLDFQIVAELDMRHPRWGAGKIAEVTQGYGLPFSRATIGRMLKRVRAKCPSCGERDGQHSELGHALASELHRFWESKRERKEEERIYISNYESGHKQPGRS